MWKVTNTTTDRTKSLLHRSAPGFSMEPMVAGRRLMMGKSTMITDAQYKIDKTRLDQMVQYGMIELTNEAGEKAVTPPVEVEKVPEVVPEILPEPELEVTPEAEPPMSPPPADEDEESSEDSEDSSEDTQPGKRRRGRPKKNG